MKVVIDIPENDYNYIKQLPNIGVGDCLVDNVYNAITNGTVLPKEHGDLIDRSKLVFYRCKENVMDCPPNYDFTCQNCEYGWTCRLNIDEAPIIVPADKGE